MAQPEEKNSWFDSEISPDGDSVVAWIGKGSAAFETGDVKGEVNGYIGKLEVKRDFKFSFYKETWDDKQNGAAKLMEGTVGVGVDVEALSVDGSVEAGDDMFGSELSAMAAWATSGFRAKHVLWARMA